MAVGVNVVSQFDPTGINRATKSFKNLKDEGNKTSASLAGFGKAIAGSVATLAKFSAGAAAAAGVVAYKLVDAASNLQESQSKVNAVFGESAGVIQDFAKTTSRELGITRQAALEAAGTFGNLIQAFGIARPAAAGMSEELVRLAADLASFNNVPIEEVFIALRSGLSGETEPLKRFGVAINDVRLKQEALNMGLYDGKGALDITAKTQAAYALILKDTALAQGDVERTADGFANQMRFLKAQLADAAAELGVVLLPYAQRFVSFLNDNVVPAVRAFAESLSGGDSLTEAMGIFVDALGPFGIRIQIFFAEMKKNAYEAYLGVVEALKPAVALIDITGGLLAALVGKVGPNIMANAQKAVMDQDAVLRQLNLELGQAALRSREYAKEQRILGAESGRLSAMAREYIRQQNASNDETKKQTGGTKKQTDAIKEAQKQLEKYIDVLKGRTAAERDVRDATRAKEDADTRATEAAKRLTAAQERYRRVVSGYGADSKEAKDQQTALNQAQRRVERSGYGVEGAVFAVARAEEELAAIRLDPEASATAIREAEIALAEAKLNVADATEEQSRAAAELTDAEQRLQEVVNGAKEGSQAFADALAELTDAQRAEKDAADEVTKAYERQTDALIKLREAEQEYQRTKKETPVGLQQKAQDFIDGKVTEPQKGANGLFPSFMQAVQAMHPNSRALDSATPVRAAKAQFPKLYETYKAAGLALAKGGIVNSPTTALIGEAGPEAVIPLDQLQSGMNIVVNINAGMGTDPAALGDEIVNVLQRYNRRNGALPLKVA